LFESQKAEGGEQKAEGGGQKAGGLDYFLWGERGMNFSGMDIIVPSILPTSS
jgi:hypothetical protein